MSVVVAYGATEESEAALAEAVAEAVRRQKPLHVLLTDAGADAPVQERLEREGRLSKWVLHQVPEHQSRAHAVLDVAVDVAAEVIVIGTRRRSPVGKLLMGSLAQEILLGADIPVLVVKP
jgi:nucleotide-binding universal stress UspA family protein